MALGTRIQFEQPGAPRVQGCLTAVLSERLSDTIDRGVNHLLSLQASEGYWWANSKPTPRSNPTTSSTCTSSTRPTPSASPNCANYVRRRQLPDGGWNIYFGGPSELNATVKAYFALKLAGDSPDAPHMQRARRARPRTGRPRSHEFLHALLSGLGRRRRLGYGAGGSAGADAAAELVRDQYLRDVFVDARHRDSAGDSLRAQAAMALARRRVRWTNCSAIPRATALPWIGTSELFSWRNFFLALDRA